MRGKWQFLIALLVYFKAYSQVNEVIKYRRNTQLLQSTKTAVSHFSYYHTNLSLPAHSPLNGEFAFSFAIKTRILVVSSPSPTGEAMSVPCESNAVGFLAIISSLN